MVIIAGYRRAVGLLSRGTDAALLLTRLVLGWFMMLHGLQKVRAPGGVASFQQLLVSLRNVPFPGFTGAVLPWVEVVGGILLLAGALTRVAAAVLAGEMAIIIPLVKVADLHASLLAASGSPAPSAEPEYMYLAGLVVLLLLGPGRISVDAAARLEPGRPAAPQAQPDGGSGVPPQSQSSPASPGGPA